MSPTLSTTYYFLVSLGKTEVTGGERALPSLLRHVRLGDQVKPRVLISFMALVLTHTLNWSLSQVFWAQGEGRELDWESLLYAWLCVNSP